MHALIDNTIKPSFLQQIVKMLWRTAILQSKNICNFREHLNVWDIIVKRYWEGVGLYVEWTTNDSHVNFSEVSQVQNSPIYPWKRNWWLECG
jgi:hypothetical protein